MNSEKHDVIGLISMIIDSVIAKALKPRSTMRSHIVTGVTKALESERINRVMHFVGALKPDSVIK